MENTGTKERLFQTREVFFAVGHIKDYKILLSDRRFAKGNGNQFVCEYLGYDLWDDLLMGLPPPVPRTPEHFNQYAALSVCLSPSLLFQHLHYCSLNCFTSKLLPINGLKLRPFGSKLAMLAFSCRSRYVIRA